MDLDTATGQAVARILGATARLEVQHKADRQARARAQAATKGKWNGGRRPLGYEHDGVTVCVEEAEALREAARRISAGHDLAAVTRYVSAQLDYPNCYPKPKPLTEEEIAEGVVREWSPNGVPRKTRVLRDVLVAPRIAGYRQYLSTVERDAHASARENGTARGELLADVAALHKAGWQSILTRQEWLDVRRVLLSPSRRSNKRRPRKSLLGGIIFCGECQGVMGYSTTSYKCAAKDGSCGKVSISTPRVEELVLRVIEVAISASELDLFDPLAPPDMMSDRNRLKLKLNEIWALYKADVMALAECTERRTELNAELLALDDLEDDVARQNAALKAAAVTAKNWDEAERVERA